MLDSVVLLRQLFFGMNTFPKRPSLLVIDNVMINSDVLTAMFRCDVSVCKGACCVEGERGAMISSDEVGAIEQVLDTVKKYLPEKNLSVLDSDGIYETYQGELYLNTVGGRECVFASFDARSVAQCNLERAYLNGETTFRKPVSCHLYPIRVQRKLGMEYLVYSQIPECEGGRRCGAAEGVPLYEFVAPALERRFGRPWLEKFLSHARSSRASRA